METEPDLSISPTNARKNNFGLSNLSLIGEQNKTHTSLGSKQKMYDYMKSN